MKCIYLFDTTNNLLRLHVEPVKATVMIIYPHDYRNLSGFKPSQVRHTPTTIAESPALISVMRPNIESDSRQSVHVHLPPVQLGTVPRWCDDIVTPDAMSCSVVPSPPGASQRKFTYFGGKTPHCYVTNTAILSGSACRNLLKCFMGFCTPRRT